jgi:hypothetical protein
MNADADSFGNTVKDLERWDDLRHLGLELQLINAESGVTGSVSDQWVS